MNNALEKLYSISPIFLQQLMVTIFGIGWYRRRFNPIFHRLVRELKEKEYWDEQQIADYQQNQFHLLMMAAKSAPYYMQKFTELKISPDRFTVDDLPRLPFLSKEEIRTNPEGLLSQNPPPKGTMIQKTSGTTGTSTHIYYTREFHAFELAVPEARNLNRAGVCYKDRRVMFGVRKVCNFDQSKPPFWRYSPAENMAYASIYHLSPRFLPDYLIFLRKYKPDVIMGYPSALAAVARYAVENNDIPSPAKAIFTMSETLHERDRMVIEKAWSARIFDRYGAVEGCVFASQCECGKYHLSPEVGIIEILDESGRLCPPGMMGEVVCTGLQNFLQPLIRYRIGDVARWALDQHCSCGRHTRIIEGVEGRVEDVCVTRDGRKITRFDTVFKGVETIKEAQVVQEDWELFTIYVTPGKDFIPSDIDTLRKNMKSHVGNVTLKVELVQEIPRSGSGKFRAVICKLSSDQKRKALGNLHG